MPRVYSDWQYTIRAGQSALAPVSTQYPTHYLGDTGWIHLTLMDDG